MKTQNQLTHNPVQKLTAAILTASVLCALPLQAAAEETESETAAQTSEFAVSEAVYPEMASYPNEEEYIGKDGIFDSKGFDTVYDAWAADRQERFSIVQGNTEELKAFYADTLSLMLTDRKQENPVYSPVNIYMALGMLAEITDGATREQILKAAHTESPELLKERTKALWTACYVDDTAKKSILANSLWLDRDIAFSPDIVQTLTNDHYASVFQGDFGSPELDAALQKWVNDQTGGLLKEQAQGLKLSPEEILAIASTIWFKAKWDHEFSESRTFEDVFHAESGDETADFMHQDGMNSYCYGEQFSSVDLHFADGGYMSFILPDEGVSIDSLLNDAEFQDYLNSDPYEWENSAYPMIHLSVPKFDVTSEYDLVPVLQSLGITDVFDQNASNFSGLTENPEDAEGLSVSQAKHAARVKIDETGVEAAAYTVMMTAGAALPQDEIDFVLDRPFLFTIHSDTGITLFAGVVNHAAP